MDPIQRNPSAKFSLLKGLNRVGDTLKKAESLMPIRAMNKSLKIDPNLPHHLGVQLLEVIKVTCLPKHLFEIKASISIINSSLN